MDVMQAAAAREAQGHKVIHMEVGQPGTPAPRAALEAVKRALDRETLGYTMALGLPALRARIARHYRQRYGVDVAPERVVVTTGSSAAFVLAFLALFDVGAKVALPSPGYPCYRHILTALGQAPVMLTTDAASRWMPTAAQIDEAATREALAGLVIASPANPTGTMLEAAGSPRSSRPAGATTCGWSPTRSTTASPTACRRRPRWPTAPKAIVVNSFSKYFSMTGWRVGWLVVPEELVRPIERLAQNLYISPPTVSQVAALGAFDGVEELEANKRVYAENRALLLGELPKAGLEPHRARPMAPSTSTSMSATSRPTASPSPGRCWPISASPPRRASTSTPSAAAATCASATPARRRTWPRRRAGCKGWSRLKTRG